MLKDDGSCSLKPAQSSLFTAADLRSVSPVSHIAVSLLLNHPDCLGGETAVKGQTQTNVSPSDQTDAVRLQQHTVWTKTLHPLQSTD